MKIFLILQKVVTQLCPPSSKVAYFSEGDLTMIAIHSTESLVAGSVTYFAPQKMIEKFQKKVEKEKVAEPVTKDYNSEPIQKVLEVKEKERVDLNDNISDLDEDQDGDISDEFADLDKDYDADVSGNFSDPYRFNETDSRNNFVPRSSLISEWKGIEKNI